MDVREKRQWMYNRVTPDRRDFTKAFMKGVDEFLEHACQLPNYSMEQIRCPCAKCKNRKIDIFDVVKTHIYKHGFLPDYYEWTSHGEGWPMVPPIVNPSPNDQPMINKKDHGQCNQYKTKVKLLLA